MCGLPTNGRLFALLPPHFDLSRTNISTTLLRMIPDVFPYVGRKCLSMLKYGVASLLTHERWLRSNLPNTSSIWLSPLFTDREETSPLKDAIISDLTSSVLHATGVPPHIDIHGRLDDIGSQIGDLPTKLADAVKQLIEDYATAPNITQEALERTLARVLLQANISSQPQEREPMEEPLPVQSSRLSYHTWNGGFHVLPQDFAFPDATVEQTWLAWWIGDRDNNVPPYRAISGKDISSAKQRRRFSDICVLMRYIEEKLRAMSQLLVRPSISEVREMYQAVLPELHFMMTPLQNGNNAKRPHQWKLPYAVKRFRAYEKAHQER